MCRFSGSIIELFFEFKRNGFTTCDEFLQIINMIITFDIHHYQFIPPRGSTADERQAQAAAARAHAPGRIKDLKRKLTAN
jgi:hypothetical protein